MGAYADQLRWKREIVASQLRHLGGLREVEVRDTLAPGPPYGYRNRMDFQVAEGRPALLAARSQRQVRIEHCHLLAGPLQALFAELGEVRGSRVTLRAGLRTGETVVLVDGSRGVIHEEVAGVRFRITGRAFFQTNTWGADALVRLVREALDPAPGELLLDGYSGGGLFSATVGAGLSVVAVESDRVAVSDLRHNTEYVTVVTSRFEHARPALPPSWDLAVVDPPRRGLNQTGCRVVADGRPRVICYVSCDPATFARDARYLAGMGYRISWVQPVDLFPQTFHVELVACFRREEAGFLSQT
jgi:tRNA/tmRNA/rRNA uracil-C5-methylase (TrmA/RlmC/RlmD family)